MKRRITSILVILSMAFTMMPFFALPANAAETITPVEPANANSENVGSVDNPYKIASKGNLVWFRDKINGGVIPRTSCADLTTDLDFTGATWAPMTSYGGVFDGRNHTISNISYSGTSFVGLIINNLNGAGMVKNLHIYNGYIAASDSGAGGIVGVVSNHSGVSNCSFANGTSREEGYWCAGSIVGEMDGDGNYATVRDCYGTGNVLGRGHVGGICGFMTGNTNDIIERCYTNTVTYNTGTQRDDWKGGILGCVNTDNSGGTRYIRNCYTLGTVYDGGGLFVGRAIGATYVSNCFNYTTSTWNWVRYGGYVSNVKTLRTSGYNGDTLLSAGQFATRTSFNSSWDFDNVWELTNGKYPTFKKRIDNSEKSRTLKIYDNQVTTFNLTDYFDLIWPSDGYYNQDNRFTFTIEKNATETESEFNSDTMENEVKTYELASVDGDILTLDGSAFFGTYEPITIKAHDTRGIYDDYTFDLSVIVRHQVPKPEVLAVDLSYSRSLILDAVPITEDWYWVDGTICPKNTNTTGYKVHYPCEDWITAENYATYYDLSALTKAGLTATYDAESNSIITRLKVDVAETDDSPRTMNITVLNADYPDSSPKPIPNATVTCDYEDEFPDGHVTDEKGEVYAEISPGKKELKVSADGYQSKTETVEILGKPNRNAPVVKLVPVRTEFTASPVRIQGTNEDVPDARVSITRLTDTIYDTPAEAWNNGADSLTCDAEHVFELPDGFPDGRYMLKNATYGWSHDGVVYAKVADGKVEYFEDRLCKNRCAEQTTGKIIYATKLSEPIYYLEINKADDGDATHYVASVRLKNIAATYGTFGISWDPELFKLSKVTLGSSIKSAKTPEKMYDGADLSMEEYSKKGYYAFLWSAGDNTSAVLDTEMAEAEIATFDMYLNDASLADMLTVDSFSIVRWTDVKAARDWAAAGKKASSSFTPKFWQYWRECDSDNIRTNLQEGRIDATKSVVNGVEMNGFFQAAINGAVGDDNPSSFYDVMTDLQYGFPIKNSVIRFHVIDLYSGDEVEGAKVKLFDDTATKLLQSKSTAYTGRANFTVNTADKADPRFAYEVTRTGYWPLPLSQLDTDRPFVRTTTGKATEVEVRLDKKVYHDTVIARNEDNEAQQTIELVKSADLSGERYAYNGREFHFRVKGAKGYRITKYPTRAWVSIGDENAGDTRFEDIELEPSASGLFTLDAKYLIQDSLTKEYMEDVLGYEDVGEQPDSEGYRSYNIEVKFDKFEVIELDYLVEGMTGEHGTVSYNHAVPAYEGTYQGLEPYFPSPYTEGDYTTDIKIRTHKSQKDTSTEPATTIPANHKTGTFTFKADEGYVVERVYINGLQTSIYDDLTTFDYSFGEVDKDCSIIVMFWDGETPSKDTVLTLVVGDWGYVDTLSPKEEEDLICTRRTYLNPTESLVFTTNADKLSTDYELYMVERELEGDKRVDITDKAVDGKYTVEPVEGKNVIAYVTFKNKKAEITPTLFVKSYVYSGQGVADPAGILIYNFFDSVEIDLVADSENKWLARGVMLSPYDDLTKTSEYEFETKLAKNTYRYDSLQESIAIGSVFMEKAYPIEGYIDLGQKSDVSGAPLSGAVVKFVRLDDTTKEEKPKQVPFYTDSTSVRSNSKFEMELPAGYWNVYVMKQGYVTYKITNFKMDTVSEGDVRHFGYGSNGQQKIVPMIGSTRSGDSVTLEDAADVKSGMRKGVSSEVFNMTDVDNSGQVNYIDLAYVWFNYNKYMFEQDYMDFEANGSKDVEKMTTPVAPTET